MEQEIKFEKALERLEKIVEDLESGNMPLEEALKKYEEGVGLCRSCTKKLEQAQTKIEVLTRALSGTLESESKDADRNAKKGERKKTGKEQKTSPASGDELLL